MKDFIFSLGIIDRKLIWPFLYTIIQLIRNIFSAYFPKEKKISDLLYFDIGIGESFIILVPYVLGYKNPNQKKEKKCTKPNIKHYFLLLFFNGIYYCLMGFNSLFNDRSVYIHSNTDYTKEVIEIIFLTIISFLILKYKYFIHHIISLILFCILSLGIDLLLNSLKENYSGKNLFTIIFDIFSILLQILNYCYQKYMMEFLYHNYWNISFAIGLNAIFISIILLIVSILKGHKNLIDDFKEKEVGYILLYLISQIIIEFFARLFRILTLNYQTPNHMLISYDIVKMFVILRSDIKNKWYSIIIFIFQFISLTFFLEIFEFNFWGLNKNTKRNINKRAITEGSLEIIDYQNNRNSNLIELDEGEGYILEEEKKENAEDEMNNSSNYGK